jgi:hypothetical protein
MASNLSQIEVNTIINTLSPLRISTFQNATGFSAGADALEIYTWNALTSGAFFSSLHICEIVIRNGVAGAIERTYGANWPWNRTFESSLPQVHSNQFNPRVELIRARGKVEAGETGKVIAELKFAFWCHMLTRRYDGRIWNPHIRKEFPFLPPYLSAPDCRLLIYKKFDVLRIFRNRIAHHEHIFSQPLIDHHERIKDLIKWRCNSSSYWLSQWEIVTTVLANRP